MTEDRLGFDFAAFKDAFERKDAATWAGSYAEDAEWVEYKPSAPPPPRDPIRMVGRKRIAEFLARWRGATSRSPSPTRSWEGRVPPSASM